MPDTRAFATRRKLDDLWFMHGVWSDSYYGPTEAAFVVRAVSLARLECEIHHLEQVEEERDLAAFVDHRPCDAHALHVAGGV
jgi:hypothetical protein